MFSGLHVVLPRLQDAKCLHDDIFTVIVIYGDLTIVRILYFGAKHIYICLSRFLH
jgi:hypothetical protein